MKFEAPDKDHFLEAASWLKDNQKKSCIPDQVMATFLKTFSVYSELSQGDTKAKKTLATLRLAMGIIPKSEKGSQLEIFEATPENQSKIDDLNKKIKIAETDRKRYAKQLKEFLPRIKQPKQLEFDFGPAEEPMFSFPISEREGHKKSKGVDRMGIFGREQGFQSTFDTTKRFDVRMVVTEIDYRVETVYDPETDRRVRASTLDEGPSNFQVTWGALGNLIKMHVGFAIPINRMALMIGQKEFSASKICRLLEYGADLALPIYLVLAENLSDVELLSGDDTVTKVLDKSTPEDEEHLVNKVDEHFDWASPKINGSGLKTGLNVSFLVGKTEKDPRSTIRFYRTHLGSVGNILSKLLEWRRPESGQLIFQGDLSSTNLPKPELLEMFQVLVAGCGAHARRPFWRYREDDPSLCFFLLRAFCQLAQLEKRIDTIGRNTTVILKYRNRYGRMIWNAIKTRCESVLEGKRLGKYVFREDSILNMWPKGTDLHRACNYVVNHFPELTLYLNHPHLSYTNNHSERALRIEKCMLSGSKFRGTRNGRVIIDILRTINATCTAAGIDITTYFQFIGENQTQVHSAPELYTPFKVAKLLEKKSANTTNKIQ